MLTKVKLAIGAAAIVAAFGAGWSWQGTRCDADAYKHDLAVSEAARLATADALRRYRDQINAERAISSQRADQLEQYRQQADSLTSDLQALRSQQDDDYQDCAALPVPAAIRERLRRARGASTGD